MDSTSALNQLTPTQRSALYDQAKQQALELRREAMRDAASWLAARTRALWQRAAAAAAARRTPKVSPCAN
jgi:hypothetical protein